MLPELPIIQTTPAPDKFRQPVMPSQHHKLPEQPVAEQSDTHRKGKRIESCFQRTFVSLL